MVDEKANKMYVFSIGTTGRQFNARNHINAGRVQKVLHTVYRVMVSNGDSRKPLALGQTRQFARWRDAIRSSGMALQLYHCFLLRLSKD